MAPPASAASSVQITNFGNNPGSIQGAGHSLPSSGMAARAIEFFGLAG